MRTHIPLSTAFLLLLLLAPAHAQAQGRPGAPAGPSFVVAGKVGFDTWTSEDLVAGALVRVPLPVPGRFLAQVAGDFTFLDALTERQLTVDLLYDLGGLTVGAGPVFRNTVWLGPDLTPGQTLTGERETRTGYSIVFGLGGSLGRDSPWAMGLEFRYTRVEGLRPQPLMLWAGVDPFRLF